MEIDRALGYEKIWAEVVQQWKDGERPVRMHDANVDAEARELIKDVHRVFRQSKHRQATSSFSMPAETWKVLANPNYRAKALLLFGAGAYVDHGKGAVLNRREMQKVAESSVVKRCFAQSNVTGIKTRNLVK